jgi:hypothetical protein
VAADLDMQLKIQYLMDQKKKKQPTSSIFNDLVSTDKIIFLQEKIFLKRMKEMFHEAICADCFTEQNQGK